jgi:hypothetical protein
MRVLVCGSRTFTDRSIVDSILDGLLSNDELTVIEGGAKGADLCASQWVGAIPKRDVKHELFAADWDKHGGRAGPMRNAKMLRDGKPDAVLAFIDKPLEESHGTLDMVTKARKAKVPVYIIRKY